MPFKNSASDFLLDLKNPFEELSLLEESDLPILAQEIRNLIIDTVSKTGGHLASSLGTVELTIALLRVFNPEYDKLIWDVGHQAYAYKILTGRAKEFSSLRQFGGLSGFPKMSESPYDHFGVGHSSTSISAALGMALAREISEKNNHVVSVIGDGAMTAGMVYEALNHAGAHAKPLVVIFNDNQMSISKNVGALSYFLSRNLSSRWVRRVKREVADFLQSIPGIGDEMYQIAKRSKVSFKSFFTPGILFEAFNFNYIGPVNGHDFAALDQALTLSVGLEKPVLVHVVTQKGKGYLPAENNPTNFHGVGRFSPATGEIEVRPRANGARTYTQIFANALCTLAEKDKKIIAITAAMPEGTGLSGFAEKYPKQFFDVGICEQHAVTFAAGLATQGFKPVVTIYSTFLQRSYDQIMHDVCLQNLPVVFALDRAGLVGEDGPTHHGVFDMAYLRHLPNMHILSPRNQESLERAVVTALSFAAPFAIRYSKEICPNSVLKNNISSRPLEIATGELLIEAKAKKLLVISVGNSAENSKIAVETFNQEQENAVSLFDPIWIKPLPQKELLLFAKSYEKILIIEEHAEAGGFGSAVLELFAENNLLAQCRIYRHALPDSFIEHGSMPELYAKYAFDVDGITKKIKKVLTS